jgi:hypothetical protein
VFEMQPLGKLRKLVLQKLVLHNKRVQQAFPIDDTTNRVQVGRCLLAVYYNRINLISSHIRYPTLNPTVNQQPVNDISPEYVSFVDYPASALKSQRAT